MGYRYLILFVLFTSLTSVVSAESSPCDDQELHERYAKLVQLVDIGDEKAALKVFEPLLEQLESQELTNCKLYHLVRYERGELAEFRAEFEKAFDLYYSIASAAKANNWHELLAETYLSMARNHESVQRAKDCHDYLKLAEEVITKHQLGASFSRYAVRMSSYHRIFDSRDSAMHFAKLAVSYGREYKVIRSEKDGNMLMAFLSEDEQTKIYHLREAMQISLAQKSHHSVAWMGVNIAKRYLNLGELQAAMQLLDTAKAAYPKGISENRELLYNIYTLRKTIFEKRNQHDSAYASMAELIELLRSKSILINQEEINEREKEFALAQQEAQLRYEQQQRKYLSWGLGLGAFILITLGLAFWNNRRQTIFIQKQQEQITEQNEELESALHNKSILLSEIHHRVKNNLQIIISLLMLEANRQSELENARALEHLSSKVRSMALIHERLYQVGDFEHIQLLGYFQRFAEDFEQMNPEVLEDAFSLSIPDSMTLNLETLLPVGIICSELITNSLKYASLPDRPLKINIQTCKLPDNQYELVYSDNGAGYPDAFFQKPDSGLGKSLIQSLTRQLLGKSIFENIERGASFKMKFREKQVAQV